MPIKKGEAYVLKGQDSPDYAVIVESFQGGNVVIWDTGCCDSGHEFRPIPNGKEAHFLERYEPATPEQIIKLIAELKGRERVVAQKINLLERAAAQSQPKCTDTGRRVDATIPGYSADD